MVRKSFDMRRLVAYALAAVNERGLRVLIVAQVSEDESERACGAGKLSQFVCDFAIGTNNKRSVIRFDAE
jgi:hypothetical protein